MPTVQSPIVEAPRDTHRLNVVCLAIATGVTAAVVFALCWVGTFVPVASPTQAYITLFTNADIGSGLALVQGACWSLLFGALAGAVFALIYNVTAPLVARQGVGKQ